MDLPVAARCVPGTRDVARDGDGVRGTLDVRVGPVRLALGGTVAIESRDEVAGTARLRADAEDRRVGGAVRALVDLTVTGDAPTELRIASDVAILGRIGQLGQALIARQADKELAGFPGGPLRARAAPLCTPSPATRPGARATAVARRAEPARTPPHPACLA